MDKFKAVSIALVVVSIICIALAANAAMIATQLSTERQKAAQLEVRVSDLEERLKTAQNSSVNIQKELDTLKSRLDQEVRTSQDLRNALANEQAITQNLKQEIDTLNNASQALDTGTTVVQPAVTR